ncbi:hypothetical protein B7486_55105, partial [cyanobacterium TDX16]
VGVDPAAFVASSEPFALVDDATVRSVAGRFATLLDSLRRLPCPTVAAIVGPAFGGGFELALACDLRVAATTSSFALPELRLGVLPGGGATQRLPRLVGAPRTKELLLTGRRMSGIEAQARGVVDVLVPRERVLSEAHAAASHLAGSTRWRLARQLLWGDG